VAEPVLFPAPPGEDPAAADATRRSNLAPPPLRLNASLKRWRWTIESTLAQCAHWRSKWPNVGQDKTVRPLEPLPETSRLSPRNDILEFGDGDNRAFRKVARNHDHELSTNPVDSISLND